MKKYYRDLREYLSVLEQNNKLCRVAEPINKDTELHPLVRLQFRGLKEEDRRAFLFENVYDSKGYRYSIPVAAACLAGSQDIYALGMQCPLEGIAEKWEHAQLHPINPVMVSKGAVQEVVIEGETLTRGRGLGLLPVPISTPGFDNGPYLSAALWLTKDPDSGIYNLGTYRGQIKAPDRLGCLAAPPSPHLSKHWQKQRERKSPLPVAIIIGSSPNLSYVSVARFPFEVDEVSVAGGLAGEPVEMVKCKTVDLEVPAHAEIVIEGIIPTDSLEFEGPFGEYTGYMAKKDLMLYCQVTCITHRSSPIFVSMLSQFPPSESSKIRQITKEGLIRKFLRLDCHIKGLKNVVLHEATGSWGLCVLSLEKTDPSEPMRALEAMSHDTRVAGKVAVAVDDDIDIHDPNAVNWAISWHVQPHRDMKIVEVSPTPLDYSVDELGRKVVRQADKEKAPNASMLLIDATRKWPYPPISLPKREFMEKARELWEKLNLPSLNLQEPWFGYSLGLWSQEDEQDALLAIKGEYSRVGEKFAQQRQSSDIWSL